MLLGYSFELEVGLFFSTYWIFFLFEILTHVLIHTEIFLERVQLWFQYILWEIRLLSMACKSTEYTNLLQVHMDKYIDAQIFCLLIRWKNIQKFWIAKIILIFS